LTVCSGALLNAYSSQQSLFNRNITLEYSSIAISENSASNCSVFALHSGEYVRYRSSGALGGAFGVYIGASSHATSSGSLTSLISGNMSTQNLSFLFENNSILSCFAVINVSGSAEVASAAGGALALFIGFWSFSQVRQLQSTFQLSCLSCFSNSHQRRLATFFRQPQPVNARHLTNLATPERSPVYFHAAAATL